MSKKMKIMVIGDAMIPGKDFESAAKKYLSDYVEEIITGDWENNWDNLQRRRLEVEKKGPEIEEVVPLIKEKGKMFQCCLVYLFPFPKKHSITCQR